MKNAASEYLEILMKENIKSEINQTCSEILIIIVIDKH